MAAKTHPGDAGGWTGGPAPFHPPLKLRLAYFLYQIAMHLLLPVWLVVYYRRGHREPLYRAHLLHRLGLSTAPRKGDVMVYASSLGEVRAALPLIWKLLENGYPVLLTHASAAGLAAGRDLLAEEIADGRVTQVYHPIDAAVPLWIFLARHRPRTILVVECELWPGLLFETRRFGIAAILLNGSYTPRAHERDKVKFWGLRLPLWQGFTRVTTKSDPHRERYHATGLPLHHILNVGELKFDLPSNADQIDAAKPAREALLNAAGRRHVWMIASSIEGEEAPLFETIEKLTNSLETPPLILWVPRSPQRFLAVANDARDKGYKVARRSEIFDGFKARGLSEIDMLVGDSIGEMDFYYSLADVVFVGATLYPMGGHTPIEPLALEKPVVTGPSIYGVAYPAYEARDQDALRDYQDANDLADGLVSLFSDPKALAAFQENAKGFCTAHQGAAARTVGVLKPALDRVR